MKRRYIYFAVSMAFCLIWAVSLYDKTAAHSPRGRATSAVRALHPTADVTTLVQTRLHSFGYTIVVDGDWGKQTRRVTAAWQRANGLPQTGLPNAATIASLGKISFATADPSPATRSSPPVPIPVGSESVEAIIRDVWPDDLEDWAVKIATRESNLQPGVSNACCYGLFQIHFRAHQSWLDEYGVNQPSDLFDPRVNATVALALYQQTGPGPWNL